MMADDPCGPLRTQVEVLRSSLMHAQEKIFDKTQECEHTLASKRALEGKQARTVDELNSLNEKYVRLEERYRGLEEQIKQIEKKVTRRKVSLILQAILFDVLFLLSSILAAFGVNILTSSTPNAIGWVALALAIVTYLAAAIIGVVRTTLE